MNFFHRQAGPLATYALLAATWLLIGLAKTGWFLAWPAVLPLLLLALGAAVVAWWQLPAVDRWLTCALIGVGFLLYTPPAEHWPLFGDGAIYPNEGAYLARTGSLSGVYEPLAALSTAARAPFYVANTEQFADRIQWAVQAYQGIIYDGYYLIDADSVTIQNSRMPLSEVWLALLTKLMGSDRALYNTPLWSVAALVLLYLIAHSFVARPAALWATLLLALSYPQIYFSRAPYAEIPGQFWLLLGFYFALRWLDERKPWQFVTVLLCWTTTWSGRIDALLLLGAIGLLCLVAATARDRRSLLGLGGALPLCALMVALAANVPYIGATYELVALRWSWFGAALLGLVGALLLAILLFWLVGTPLLRWLQWLAPFVHLLLFAGCTFVIAWATLPNPWRVPEVTRDYQEIIWFSSHYLTPLFYWLVLAGIGRLFWRGYTQKELFLLATVLSLAAVFFFSYTSAPVYPVSLRRMLSDLWPLMTILAAIALTRGAQQSFPVGWSHQRHGRVKLPGNWGARPQVAPSLFAAGQVASWAIGVVALGWMVWLSWPLLPQREAAGTLAFITQFHAELPANSVTIFEKQDDNSWVGWLAAPLYSLYGDWTPRLDSDEPEPALLAQAVTEWIAGGRTVYLVSQHNPLPESLLPPGYTAALVMERVWQSSLIGQTRAPYPPPYWEFAHPLYVFKLQ